MGLDSVELLIDIEETFAITIADEEAARTATVGDLHRIILEHLARPAPRPDAFHDRVCFHRLRKCIMEAGSAPRKEIRPEGRLETLLPPTMRREAWKKLARCANLELPELRPPPLLQAITISSFVVPVLALVPLSLFMRNEPLVFLVPAAGIACALFMSWGTRSFRRDIPPGFGRVSDLVAFMRKRDFPSADRPRLDGPEAVYDLMKQRIIAVLGVDESEVVPDARFVDDLGID